MSTTERGQPVWGERDREQLELDRESGFSEGQIGDGRKQQARYVPPTDRVPEVSRDTAHGDRGPGDRGGT